MLLAFSGMTLTITDMNSTTMVLVSTSTDAYNGHKLPCTEEEKSKTDCLQGKCFAVDLNPRESSCMCDSGWNGDRCEMMDLPPGWWNASLLIGLVVFLIVAVIVLGAALGFYLWKRRRGTHAIQNQENGICLDVVAETPLCSDESKE